jgi:hypothetical protein
MITDFWDVRPCSWYLSTKLYGVTLQKAVIPFVRVLGPSYSFVMVQIYINKVPTVNDVKQND